MKDAVLAGTSVGGTPIEIWFQDEARVGQKGGHTNVWAAPVGARPLMVRDNRHDSAYLFGAICPARGVGAAIIMASANSAAMNEHLKEIATQGTPRCPCGGGPGRRRLASNGCRVAGARQYHFASSATLYQPP